MSVASGRALESTQTRGGRREVAGVLVGLTILIGLVLTAFALPALHSSPRDVPIGVAGPPAAVGRLTVDLAQQAPGAFAATTYADQGALTQAIRDREIYGGVVVATDGPTVLTAPPGSPAVAQGLATLAAGLGQQTGRPVPVREVVSLPAGDPHGIGVGIAMIPLFIGSVAPVILVVRVVRRPWARMLAVLCSAVLVGATLAGLLLWFGVVDPWLLPAVGITLSLAAMSAALLGLLSLGGLPALGIGAAVFLLLGNPLSGAQTAPELVPQGWSVLGALLPPGASGQVLRSFFYFGGAAAGSSLLVLLGWLALGLALVAVSNARRPRARGGAELGGIPASGAGAPGAEHSRPARS
ncbi:MAG: hypothetical protein L0H79_12880 [Intrasporangium sp.]|uniref:hypothetical protein n=1 Tax=Intrasporangium sp. TaxID=1925024 RepID=UPI0026473D08|nr:hypothetical protein [Intrasporangium sp.]MDN5796635.1 hypothetical protein [Intrasporangium sp.]